MVIKNYIDEVKQLCEKHYVERLYLFGSANTNSFNESSDIDLLVSFENIELKQYFNNYLNLKNQLEKLFEKKIDLIESQTLKNPVLIRSINKNKQLIYG